MVEPQRHRDTEKREAEKRDPEKRDTEKEERDVNEITCGIIGAAIAVHRVLGPGLLESVYEGALCIEFDDRSIS